MDKYKKILIFNITILTAFCIQMFLMIMGILNIFFDYPLLFIFTTSLGFTLILLSPSFFLRDSNVALMGKFCSLLISVAMTVLFLILSALSCMDICSTDFITNLVRWFFYFYLVITIWLLPWTIISFFKKIFEPKISL